MSAYFQTLLPDPTSFHDAPYDEAFKLSIEQIEHLHLAGARQGFNDLRPRL